MKRIAIVVLCLGVLAWSLIMQSWVSPATAVPLLTPTFSGSLPDLIISDITYNPGTWQCGTHPPDLGARVWVANVGNEPAGAFVVEVNNTWKQTVNGLAAGEQISLVFGGALGSVTAVADATNLIEESNESNNSFSTMLPIPTLPPPCTPTPTGGLPDLLISDITYNPGTPQCGTHPPDLGARVWVTNMGNAPAGSFVVEVNNVWQQTVDGLAAGEEISLVFGGALGPVTAVADATNLIAESNESNNSFSTILPVPTLPPPCTPTPTPPHQHYLPITIK
ncbi:MAG TPA: CARDB domain-containing protein [Chloroflexota bacterium]|nr:CARDB domain-containing protein [Chloroflexota bacterium]HUM70303.1 CARDB domain-containing protein [Chloroflexota bacterium]